jgi:hypothetical protein
MHSQTYIDKKIEAARSVDNFNSGPALAKLVGGKVASEREDLELRDDNDQYLDDWDDVKEIDLSEMPLGVEGGEGFYASGFESPAMSKKVMVRKGEELLDHRGPSENEAAQISSAARPSLSPSSRFIRGGSVGDGRIWSGQGRRDSNSIKTPRLRSRVGTGIEPNFLELCDERGYTDDAFEDY